MTTYCTVLLRDVSVDPPMTHFQIVSHEQWRVHGGTLGQCARELFVATCPPDDEGDRPGVSSLEVIAAFVGVLTEMDASSKYNLEG